MRIFKPVAALLLLLGLAACTTTTDGSCAANGQPRRSPAADNTAQAKDRFLDDATLFLGVAYDFQCGDLDSSSRLKTVRDKASGRMVHQLMVRHYFESTGWRYYQQAVATEPDEPLRLSVVERQVGRCQRISWMGCQHSEEVAIDMPEQFLLAAAERPRLIRISNRDGGKGFALWLTPEQVREHLDFIGAQVR